MSDLQRIVTCAFLSYGTVPTTAKRCSPGVFLLTLCLYFLGRVRLRTYGSGLRDFCQKGQGFLRGTSLASKVCPRMSQHFRYLSLTEVRTSVFCSPGSRRFKATYKKASALEQKTTSELSTMLEIFSSWVAVIDSPSGDAPTDVVHPQELDELKFAWEKTRDSLRSALETLTSEPVHLHRSLCRSALRRWMTCFL